MEKYRTLAIGCGWRGSLHSEAVANHPRFDLVGTCDLEIAKADNIADKYGARQISEIRLERRGDKNSEAGRRDKLARGPATAG